VPYVFYFINQIYEIFLPYHPILLRKITKSSASTLVWGTPIIFFLLFSLGVFVFLHWVGRLWVSLMVVPLGGWGGVGVGLWLMPIAFALAIPLAWCWGVALPLLCLWLGVLLWLGVIY